MPNEINIISGSLASFALRIYTKKMQISEEYCKKRESLYEIIRVYLHFLAVFAESWMEDRDLHQKQIIEGFTNLIHISTKFDLITFEQKIKNIMINASLPHKLGFEIKILICNLKPHYQYSQNGEKEK